MDNTQDAVDWITKDILPGIMEESVPYEHVAVAGLLTDQQLDDPAPAHQLSGMTAVQELIGAPEIVPGAVRGPYAGDAPAGENHGQQFQTLSAGSRLPLVQSPAHAPDVPPGLESNLDQLVIDHETEPLPQEVVDQVRTGPYRERQLAIVDQVDSSGDKAVGPTSVDRVDRRGKESEQTSTDEVNRRQEERRDPTNEKRRTVDQAEEALVGSGGDSGGSGEERGSEAEVAKAESLIVTGSAELPLWQSLSGSKSMAASGMEEDLRCSLEEATESKKELVDEIERANSLLVEVAMAERCALQWEKSAVSAELQSMASMEEVQRDAAGAREALESRARELFGEQAILTSEVRELRDRLAGVEADRKAAHSDLQQIIVDLESRLAYAQTREARARSLCEDHQKSMAAAVAAEREKLARILQQADELEEEVQECRRIQKLLFQYGDSVDSLKAVIMGLYESILALKTKLRPPPGSLAASLTLAPGKPPGQSADIVGSLTTIYKASANCQPGTCRREDNVLPIPLRKDQADIKFAPHSGFSKFNGRLLWWQTDSSGLPVKSEMDMERSCRATLEEYLWCGDLKEVAACVSELRAPEYHPRLLLLWFNAVLDAWEKENAPQALVEILLSLNGQGIFTEQQLKEGLNLILGQLEDITVDAPKAPIQLGLYLGHFLAHGVLSLADIGASIREGGYAPGSLKKANLASKVMETSLEIAGIVKGASFAIRLWEASGLEKTDFWDSRRKYRKFWRRLK